MTITVNIMSYNHINFFHCFADVTGSGSAGILTSPKSTRTP